HEDELMTIAERLEQKGQKEKALEIAVRLQKMGLPFEQIKQATGLSDAELKKIIH
ncbi:transposase, partial [Salmonella enterica]|nr:transposase [Salmonella enterica]